MPCFRFCKYCTKFTKSILYQQCSECDEIDYTLDTFSYNQSLCIPKDKSNSYFIKKKTKWYIDNDNFEDLKMPNEDLIIDYERLLNKEKFYNLSYIIVENCPEEKPYIIYSIRQCVSSCNSSNLIEYGLFMTKKLYLYNGICYDKCPYGSIPDNITNTCIEINEYTSVNTSLNEYLFRKYNEIYILKYLSEYANNSVDIIRAHDFSNYFYNQTTNYSQQLQIQMPIFNFTECIEKLKNIYNLYNNSIFYGIIEYDGQTKKNKINYLINSTSFQFFIDNGTILNYEICEDINVTVEKKVDVSKIDVDYLKKIEDIFNVSLFDNLNELFNDFCLPFTIDNEDLTLYERKKLIEKYKTPCDNNCTFQVFNYSTYYSTCTCQMKNDEKKIKEKIVEEVKENDYLKIILETNNYKYFLCYNIALQIFKYLNNFKIIFPISISLVLLILQSICSICICKKKKKQTPKRTEINVEFPFKKDNKIYMNKLDNKSDIEPSLISERLKVKKNNNKKSLNESISGTTNVTSNVPINVPTNELIVDYSKMDYDQAKKNDTRKFCKIFLDSLLKNICDSINVKQNDIKLYAYGYFFTISLHTYIFVNTLLFSVNNYKAYKDINSLEFSITKQYDRFIYTFFLFFSIIKIYHFIIKKMNESSVCCNFYIIFLFLFFIMNLAFTYFIIIFSIINSYMMNILYISMIIYARIYLFMYTIICFIFSVLRFLSLKCKNKCCFDFSKFL